MNNLIRENEAEPRFLVDCMLGKLAKWLRILGFDTAFIHDAQDDELVRIAVREDRILLTRDHLLAERRLVRRRCLFIAGQETGAQIRQVLQDLGLKAESSRLFTRCSVCNAEIREMARQEAQREVPPYVYATQERFGKCSGCGRVYWRGTHVEHVLAALGAETDRG